MTPLQMLERANAWLESTGMEAGFLVLSSEDLELLGGVALSSPRSAQLHELCLAIELERVPLGVIGFTGRDESNDQAPGFNIDPWQPSREVEERLEGLVQSTIASLWELTRQR